MNNLEDESQIEMPSGQKLGFTKVIDKTPEEKEKPTFGETLKANFREFNDVYRGVSWLADKTTNPHQDDYEEGYNPLESGLLDLVPEEYAAQVISGSTRKEGELIVKKINQELEDKDTRERSGWFANLTTTLGATFFSPTTLIPLTQTVKYANVGKNAFSAAMHTAKVMGPTFAAQNAILVGTKETGTIQEWAQDTVMDTFAASAFGGALGAFAAKAPAKELKTAQAFFKAAENDIDIKYKTNEKGDIDGLVAMPRDSSVGAAQVKTVQQLLDQGQTTFKDNKLVKNTLGYMQPIIGMLTSRYKTVASFADNMFTHVNPIAGGKIGAIADPAAEDFKRLWKATFVSQELMTKQAYYKSLGISGPGKGIQATVGKLKGEFKSYMEFSEEVGRAIRRGGDSTIPEAAETAKTWIKELYDPLWAEVKKRRPDLSESDYTNIAHYLNRIYHKGKIQERPDAFVNDLVSFIDRGNTKIASLMEPLNAMKSKLEAAKKSEEIFKIKTEMSNLEKQMHAEMAAGNTAIKPKDIEKLKKLLAQEEAKATPHEFVKGESQLLEDAIRKLESEIEADIKSGKLGKELLDPKDLTKLRRVMSPEEIRQKATMIKDTVLNQNEEQMVGQIFDHITGSGESVLKERSLLWNDIEAEKWLVDDINVLGGLYMDQLSKRIHADDVLMKFGIDARDGMKGMISLFKKEHDEFEAAILKKPESPERTKELQKLSRDFQKNRSLLEKSYAVYMGSYVDSSKAVARISNGIKQFSAATLLGNLPILQLAELFTPLFRFTFDEYLADGLGQTLKRMKYIVKQKLGAGESKEAIRGAFQDVGFGMNMAHGAMTESLFGYGTQYMPKTLVERYTQNLSKISGQFNLSNMLVDFQETAVGFASQSKTIRVLKKYSSGDKLTHKEIERLDILRLNPDKWANRILTQVEKHGEDVEGAFVSNFYKWSEDFEASQIFRIALEKEVRQIITKPNLMDIPFAMRDPLISLCTQFLSFPFAATLNFGLPTMTSPDKQKFMGILLMMAGGAMIDPLRQLAKGEELDLDPRALSMSALTNSGILGWPWEAMQKINAAIDFPMLRPLQADRFRRKGAAAMLGGPFLGLADSMTSIMSALANNEMNQKDAQRAVRLLVPFSGTWFLRQPIDGVLKSYNLPETREKARRLKEAENG